MTSALIAVQWIWGAWFASWLIAAFWSNRTVTRSRVDAGLGHRVTTGAGVALLFVVGRGSDDMLKLWDTPPTASWCLVVVAIAGFAFCWWARIHLGRMWSSSVTRKADHYVVDTGPYAIVRHPIYTGVIIAAAATAMLKATATALAGCALICLGFWLKARLEERFLRNELGPNTYNAYAKRTSMLFPGL